MVSSKTMAGVAFYDVDVFVCGLMCVFFVFLFSGFAFCGVLWKRFTRERSIGRGNAALYRVPSIVISEV